MRLGLGEGIFAAMEEQPIKSVAGHVLATGEATEDEARRLAAYALGDAAPERTTRSREDLERILSKIDGQEGQAERARAIRAELERMAE